MNEPEIIQLLNLHPDSDNKKFANPMTYRVYSAQGICPAICTTGGGSHEPKIIEIMEPAILRRERTDEAKELRRKGVAKFGDKQIAPRTDGVCNTLTTFENDNLLLEPGIVQRGHGFNDGGVFTDQAPTITSSSYENNNYVFCPSMLGYTRDDKGNVTDRHVIKVANTIHTSTGGGGNTDQFVFYPDKDYSQEELRELIMSGKARVRKLTARECFRLQGVDDADIDKIYETGLSNNQMIALAGNSITVDVMFHILRKLYIDKGNEDLPTLFDDM